MKTSAVIVMALFFWAIPSTFAQSGSVAVVGNIATMTNRPPSALNPVITVTGYFTNGDWGAARVFRYIPTSTRTVDNGCVFRTVTGTGRWEADDCDGPVIDVRWFAARLDGTTDDTTAFLAAAAARRPGGTVFVPPGRAFVTTDTLALTNRGSVDFSGSTNRFKATSRKAAIRIGPNPIALTGLSIALSTSTNVITAPAGTFAVGDMVLLYNDTEDPPKYHPGTFCFITEVSGTRVALDRIPVNAFTATKAYRFVSAPEGGSVRNAVIDLSEAADGMGVSVYGKGHVVEAVTVRGTGTTDDPNYIGIEARGQSIKVQRCTVSGILDAGNGSDRSGYGIFLAGDSCTADHNEVSDCKHTIATSERSAKSPYLRITDNLLRQRGDWEFLTDTNGANLFLGNLDVHANVDDAFISGNTLESWGRYNFNIRSTSFELVNNKSLIHVQSGLPFSQHHIGFSESFIQRAYISGNRFETPDATLVAYFGQRSLGLVGTHSNLTWIGNSFVNGIFSLQDYSGTNYNPMVDVLLMGNRFLRETGTPILLSGPISNAVISANLIRYGTGNGISLAFPGTDATQPPRQVFIQGNSFEKVSGAGYDVRVISGPTNVVVLGQNRHSVDPVNGFPEWVPISLYDLSDPFPRVVGQSDGRILFGTGSTAPTTGLRALFPGSIEFDGVLVGRSEVGTDPAFGTYYGNTFSNRYNWVMRSDGLQAFTWADWTSTNRLTNTTIVVGPRRDLDLSNGVYRLTGAFGLTERSEPVIPENNAASIWLNSIASKELKIKFPDGTASTLYHSSGTGFITDSPSNSLYYARHLGGWSALGAMANFDDAPTNSNYYARHSGGWGALGGLASVDDAVSNGNTYARQNGSWVVVASGSTYTNFFTDLTNALIAGSNVTLGINTSNRTITISSTGGGGGATNGTAVSVNGGPLLSFGNLTSTTGIGITATGTNITVALVDRDFGDITVSGSGTVFTIDNGVISTNKWDATAWAWVNGKGGLSSDQNWSGTNTFTKPTSFDTINVVTLVISNAVDVPSGGTGTNTHPAQALLVGNGPNAIRHLAGAASKLAGWNSAGVVTNVAFGVGVTNDDSGGLRVNFAAGANITFTTNGTQLTIAGTAGGGSTNGTAVYIKGASASAANFVASAELDPTLTGTNVSFALVVNSVGTNKIDSTFYNWVSGKQSALTFSTGTTNAGGTVTVALAAGSGVTFATNANTITISSSGAGSSVFVKGASVSSPNFVASAEIDPSVTGTNVAHSIVASSIATNKVDATFHAWVNGKQTPLTFSTGTTNSGGTVTAALSAGTGVTFATNGNTITIATTNAIGTPVTVSNVMSRVGALEFELVIDGGGGAAPPNWTNYVQNVTASGVITGVYALTATTNSGNYSGLTYFDIGVRLNAAMSGLSSTNVIIYNQRRTQQSPTNGVNRYVYTDAQVIYPELVTTNLPLLVWSQPSSTYSLGTGSAGIHTWTNRVFIDLYQVANVTFGAPTNGVDIQIFTNTAGATWTKPAGAKQVEIFCIGGGGGGGSGRRGTNAHAGGGGGGSGGNMFMWTFSASELGATETVIVGTNGLGAVGQTSDSTDGIAGSAGGNSSVGTVALGGGGPGGGAGFGTGSGAGSGQAPGQYRGSGGTAGAHGSSASAPTLIQDRPGGAAGGGGGGSITTAGATNAAAAGGALWLTSLVPGGAAGTAAGVNGTNGTAFGFTVIPRPGSGGGGGYPGSSTIGIGGNGGWPGGGGGGGAGSKNGTTSGAGGNGASGVVIIKTYF